VQTVFTSYDEMPGARAGCLVNGALDCPGSALLYKAPNLVRTEVRDEHLIAELHNLERNKKGPSVSSVHGVLDWNIIPTWCECGLSWFGRGPEPVKGTKEPFGLNWPVPVVSRLTTNADPVPKWAAPNAAPSLMKPRWVGPPPWVGTLARRVKPPVLRSSARELMDPVSVSSVA
jgi:hypothetical protein